MNVLITASTIKEIDPFISHLASPAYSGSADMLITGVGIMSTTYSLLKQIAIRKPGMIIQVGVAGSFEKKYGPGTVVAIEKDTVADLGVVDKNKFRSVFDLGLFAANQFPFKKGWLQNPDISSLNKTGLPVVKAATVNQVTTVKQKDLFIEKYRPSIESMEGAALHYVGLMEKIPFIQLRAVSNYIGERDKKKWELKEAISNLNYELIRLLEAI